MPRSARKTSLETRSARAQLPMRRAPYFVKIAKGLRLGYYRGSAAGTWIGRRYRGGGTYNTVALGRADDLIDADRSKVLDFWQAQGAAREWAENQRLVEEGIVRGGPYTVADAVHDYIDAVRAEKGPAAERGAKYIFNASILPELGPVLIEKLTADRLLRWRNSLATRPKRVRTKRMADRLAMREIPDNDDARRKRKATANRILTMLKAALNRAFQAGRVATDQAWRRVKPFAKVDEAVVRYLTVDEARRLVSACNEDFRRLVQAALLTGCRYSELRRLRAAAFNPDSGTLAIRLSKGKVRHVTLADEGRLCFQTWTRSLLATDYVFLRGDGVVWGASHQQRPLEQASRAAAIAPPVTFHILRHTHASHLAMRGVPMAVIAKQLGHADTRMTEKHYAHLAPNYVADTIRASFPVLGIAEVPAPVAVRDPNVPAAVRPRGRLHTHDARFSAPRIAVS
jgi:integrase